MVKFEQGNRKKNFLWIILTTFILLSTQTFATDYYVDPSNGNDNNQGTKEKPWKTITKANNTLKPGDIVYLRSGNYTNQSIAPKNSGLANAYITYKAFPNEKPVLSKIGTAIKLEHKSYIIIDGIYVNGGGIFEASNVKHWATLLGAHHCIVRNCDFRYAEGWHGVLLEEESSFNKFLNNYFDYCGTWSEIKTTTPGEGDDKGDLFFLKCGKYNLIEGNIMKHGGHDIIVVDDKYNVIRKNVFDGDWSDWGKGADIGTRAGAFSARTNKNCSNNGTAEEDAGGYNVIEYNIFKNARWFPDNISNLAVKLFGVNQIFRFNRVGNNIGYGLRMATRDEHPYAIKNKVYNNVIFNNTWSGISIRDYDNQGSSMSSNVFKNNIYYNNGLNPYNRNNDKEIACDHSISLIWLNKNNPFDDNYLCHNIFYNKEKNASINIKNAGGNQSVDYHQDKNSKYIWGNIEGSPLFATESPNIDKDADFYLKLGSSAIDAGDFLTYATGSGSGKVITLKDAGYFSDGFGVAEADLIQIGTNQPVKIIKVDYENNKITVEQTITWKDGDKANLPYNGKAPDIGIFEFASNDKPSPQPAPVLKFSGDSDFGSVEVGKTIEKSFIISNEGNDILKVTNIDFPEGFKGDWLSGEIKSGESRVLKGVFEPLDKIIYKGDIVITSNTTRQVFHIQGEGIGTDNNENLKPSVQIISPVSNSQFEEGSDLEFLIEASDPDGSIAKVELFEGSKLIETITGSPFKFIVRSVLEGTHSYFVKVTDNDGANVTSAKVVINIKGPEIIIPPSDIMIKDLILVDAVTDKATKTLQDGDVIDISTLENGALNIIASPNNDLVKSVKFELSGALDYQSTESAFPYTLYGDKKGDFHPWEPSLGKYTLIATPFSEKYGQGIKGNPLMINITFVKNFDKDNDGISDVNDNCPEVYNPDQEQATWYADKDGDGFGDSSNHKTACVEPDGYVSNENDCNDNDKTINPNTIWYEDLDGNGLGNPLVFVKSCNQPDNYVSNDDDTNDNLVPSPDETSITLINADTDEDLFAIKDGSTIKLSSLPTRNLSIRANSKEAGSVKFYLNNKFIRTESVRPFAIAGDKAGDYHSWEPTIGDHLLKVEFYSEKKGGGYLIQVIELNIKIIDSSSIIDGFSLINTDNDQLIGQLSHNDIIDLSILKSRNFTIKANIESHIGSIKFYLNGEEYNTENNAPFSIAGDTKGDFQPWKYSTGNYNLKTIAFEEKNGTGKELATYSIDFSIVDEFVLTSPQTNSLFETGEEIKIAANVPSSSNNRTSKIKVEFYVDNYKIGEDDEYPYEISWSTFTKGNHKIDAKMVTISNEPEILAVAPEVVIDIEKLVNLLPTVKMLTHQNQTFNYGIPVPLEVSAYDKDGNIVKIELYDEEGLVAELQGDEFRYDWKYPEPGYYKIEAVAIDDDQESSTSEPVQIVVLNVDGSYPQKSIQVVIPEVESPILFEPEEEVALQDNIEMEINFGPNPVNSSLNIGINHPQNGKVEISMTDINGRTIFEESDEKISTEFSFQKDFSTLNSGVYFINIDLNGQKETLKIIKK